MVGCTVVGNNKAVACNLQCVPGCTFCKLSVNNCCCAEKLNNLCLSLIVLQHFDSSSGVKITSLHKFHHIASVHCAPAVNCHLVAATQVDIAVCYTLEVNSHALAIACIGKLKGITCTLYQCTVTLDELVCVNTEQIIVLIVYSQHCKLILSVGSIDISAKVCIVCRAELAAVCLNRPTATLSSRYCVAFVGVEIGKLDDAFRHCCCYESKQQR